MTTRSKHAPCLAHPDGKHRWVQAPTPECKFEWQWQLLCACGVKKNDGVYGVAIKKEQLDAVTAANTPLPEPAVEPKPVFSLDSPIDLSSLVTALFDSGLHWPTAVKLVQPELTDKEIYEKIELWQPDLRVVKAISDYVSSLSDENLRRASLIHLSEKLARDEDASAAVRSTALNILKSAHIIEKSHQHQTSKIQVTQLPDILEGIGVPQLREDELPN